MKHAAEMVVWMIAEPHAYPMMNCAMVLLTVLEGKMNTVPTPAAQMDLHDWLEAGLHTRGGLRCAVVGSGPEHVTYS